MSEIIRRKKAVPVEARRAEPGPDVIHIPGAGPIHVPPAAPGVTQNIIYVNVPQGQAPPQQAAAAQQPGDPREVHYHTTNIYQTPRRKRSGRGTSFLGTLGLVVGGVAIGAAYVPPIAWMAKPIAVGGFGCAGFGFIGALLFNRVGKLMPMVAMIVCVLGYYLWSKNTGQPMELPKVDSSFITIPAAPAVNTPIAPVDQPAAPAVTDTRPKDHSIFGDGNGEWMKPTDSTPTTPITPATPSTPLTPPLTPPGIAAPAALDVVTAAANLEKARQDAASRLNLDYTGAKTAAVAAASRYQQAKIDDSPGSPELVAASKAHLDADSQLNAIVIKLRSDASVVNAEQALKSAKLSAK